MSQKKFEAQAAFNEFIAKQVKVSINSEGEQAKEELLDDPSVDETTKEAVVGITDMMLAAVEAAFGNEVNKVNNVLLDKETND